MRGLQRGLDAIVPPLVIAFMIWGWYICCFEIGVGWLLRYNSSVMLGLTYLLIAHIVIPTSIILYLRLYTLNFAHDTPPLIPPQSFSSKTAVYECLDATGALGACFRDNCAGRWKPPRGHHCGVCGMCRMEWDHHCPWIGTCVTRQQLKDFLLFLYVAPISICFLSLPIVQPLWTHIGHALEASQADDWVNANWWDCLYSWVICAGPAGRWTIGTLLGYRVLQRDIPDSAFEGLGSKIKEPSVAFLMTVLFAWAMMIFAVILAVTTTRNVLRGQTTIEALRRRPSSSSSKAHASGTFFWIPPVLSAPNDANDNMIAGCGVRALSTENPYDLGPSRNFTSMWNIRKRKSRFDLELNDKMVRRMVNEMRQRRSVVVE